MELSKKQVNLSKASGIKVQDFDNSDDPGTEYRTMCIYYPKGTEMKFGGMHFTESEEGVYIWSEFFMKC